MKRPLSIGLVCYPSLGGSGIIASDLAVGLAERGHHVHLIASALPARVTPSHRLQFHAVHVPGYALFEHAPYDLAVASRIVDVAHRERLDLIHVHYAVPHAASAYLARQMLDGVAPRVITSLHGTDVTGVGAHPSYQAVTRFAVLASDGVTAPSQYLRAEAHRRFDIPAARSIEVIPNFVDTDRFTPGEPRRRGAGGPVLFHVSNFRPVKRVGDLIDVLALVRRELPARLVLVGDGPERRHAEERAQALGLAEHVDFLGKRTDFVAELRAADAFVLTSEVESFGVAAIEAMSAGVPVYGYRVGGLPEVIPDGVGALVDPFDTAALARAILAGVAAPAREHARAHVLAHFRREPALDRYEAYFRRILEPT